MHHAVGGGDWTPDDTFASRLVSIRHHLRLSQEEAATRCGINPKTWATWELGRRPQGMNDVVQKIRKGLGVNPSWLMWGGASSAWLQDTEEAHQLSLWPVLVRS